MAFRKSFIRGFHMSSFQLWSIHDQHTPSLTMTPSVRCRLGMGFSFVLQQLRLKSWPIQRRDIYYCQKPPTEIKYYTIGSSNRVPLIRDLDIQQIWRLNWTSYSPHTFVAILRLIFLSGRWNQNSSKPGTGHGRTYTIYHRLIPPFIVSVVIADLTAERNGQGVMSITPPIRPLDGFYGRFRWYIWLRRWEVPKISDLNIKISFSVCTMWTTRKCESVISRSE